MVGPVAALAMLLAGCGGLEQSTTFGVGNLTDYRPGQTLVAVMMAQQREATEPKLVEHLAALGVAAETSLGLLPRAEDRRVLDEATALGRFDTVLLVWEGVNSRTLDLPSECFAEIAAGDVTDWLLSETVLSGKRSPWSLSGTALKCVMRG